MNARRALRVGQVPAVLTATLLLATACGEKNYAEDLEQPPTAGLPTAGPGSGQAIADHLYYTMQKNNPETKYDDASCPDVFESRPGATVTCEMTVDDEKADFTLRMDADGTWQIVD